MQVTETNSDGLKREFKVVVPAGHIETKVQMRLTDLSRTVNIPGFRPGKAPMALLRKKYGPSVMGEVLEMAVNDGTSHAITERGLRPAIQPKIEITSYDEGKDLEFTVALETLPEIKPTDFSKIELTRLTATIPEAEIDTAVARMAERQQKTEPVTKARASKSGDVVVIDFVGKVDGVEFPGGKAQDFELTLGSGTFIPGFEDQLIGAKAGAAVAVKVTFPEDYGSAELAGKLSEFDVTVKEIREVVPTAIDDELAKAHGLENLDSLKAALRVELGREYAQVSRGRLKRSLLDVLADRHDFPVPQGMVDMEFEAIWKQLEDDRKNDRLDPADQGKSDDELKAEYQPIAERRVRLGLLLSEVGRVNNVSVTQEDINRALMNEARRYPGQEQMVIQYYQSNPQALDSLKAPIYEEKVVDFILELAKVTDKDVSPEDLLKDPDERSAPASGEKPAKKAAAKKPAAKKADDDAAAENPAAKKAPAKKKGAE